MRADAIDRPMALWLCAVLLCACGGPSPVDAGSDAMVDVGAMDSSTADASDTPGRQDATDSQEVVTTDDVFDGSVAPDVADTMVASDASDVIDAGDATDGGACGIVGQSC